MTTPRSTNFLMANLGSEMLRFLNLKNANQAEAAENSAQRALDLIQKLSKQADIGNGAKEVAILKDLIQDAKTKSPQYHLSAEELNQYFAPFSARVLQEIQKTS